MNSSRCLSTVFTPIFLVVLVGAFILIPSSLAHASAVSEIEPNNDAATAQTVTNIGTDNPINSSINPSGDQDWYSVNAIAGQTYVVEVFNVTASLGSVGGANCNNIRASVGLSLILYDASVTELNRECYPSGAGNVHNIIETTPNVAGVFYVEVLPGANTVSGSYSIRVLPKHGDPALTWDATFEPNNRAANAYAITPGTQNALQAAIEPRGSNFSTTNADIDWYRVDAVAGQTYVVEVFNVTASLGSAGGANCNDIRASVGLSLILYDASVTELKRECYPSGAGNVHNIIETTPNVAGVFYVEVLPGANTVSGSYSIRVLPKHGDPALTWDATFEPNNRAANAYAITPGTQNALQAAIEPRGNNFSTTNADIDWYRVDAIAGQTYVIEVFNVAASLGSAGGANCSDIRASVGLSLILYDASVTELKRECYPSGAGNIHNSIEFMPNLNGIFYFQVTPGADTVAGNYSVRVRLATEENKVFLPFIHR